MSTENNKRQKTDTDLDDLFEEVVAPMVVTKPSSGGDAAPLDSSLNIPDGYQLAYNPGNTNKVKARIVGSSPKFNQNGPTSIKLSCEILDIKDPGADLLRAGSVLTIGMSKNDKVKTETGIDVNARLIPTNTTPVFAKSTNIFPITLTLGKITQKGLKEQAVAELTAGATVELTDVYFNTSGMGVPWTTCSEFKVLKKIATLEGAREAVGAVAKSGNTLVLSAALNSVALREDNAPFPDMQESFQEVKQLAVNTKSEISSALKATYPMYETPTELLKFEDSETQLAPVLAFGMSKIANNDKGILFNDAKRAIVLKRRDDSEGLAALFAGGAIVASSFGNQRSFAESKLSGRMHVVPTKQMYIPSIASVTPDFGPKNILTLAGPTLKIPMAIMAAPFGVNESTTAELLMDNLMPFATMGIMPAKAKIFTRDYDNKDYIQDVYIESDQFTIDILTTFHNVALKISPDTTAKLFNGADFSVPVQISGESLVDAMGGDRKPVVSTLTKGGVASLRETPVPLNDDTLEFYAVVPGMGSITQAAGNLECGTNTVIGDAAFLAAGGGDVEVLANMLKKGDIAIFAVRVKAKTIAVDAN